MKNDMKNYHTSDNFTIWADKDYRYFIQMKGKEMEDKAYDRASTAMEEAYNRWKITLNQYC